MLLSPTRFAFITLVLLSFAPPSSLAIDVAISTSNPSSIDLVGPGTFTVGTGDAVAFNSDTLTMATRLVDIPVNLKAFHILDNGNYLISGNTGATFGSNSFAFDDDEVVEYNPSTGEVSMFFDFGAAGATTNFDLDINAIAVLPGGDIVFSNTSPLTILGAQYERTDVIRFTPVNGGFSNVSLFFDGDLISGGDRFNNLSGVSVRGDTMALSVSTGGGNDIMLGGHTFTRNDVVLYDLNTGVAREGFEGDVVFGSAGPIVDAVHLGESVPEPSTALFLLTASLPLMWQGRR